MMTPFERRVAGTILRAQTDPNPPAAFCRVRKLITGSNLEESLLYADDFKMFGILVSILNARSFADRFTQSNEKPIFLTREYRCNRKGEVKSQLVETFFPKIKDMAKSPTSNARCLYQHFSKELESRGISPKYALNNLCIEDEVYAHA